MPVTKFESYNASDVRSGQKKLAGAGLRGGVAAHGARQRAPVSRDQSLEQRRPATTPGSHGEDATKLQRRFPSYPAATAAFLSPSAGRKKRCRVRALPDRDQPTMAQHF